MNQADQNQIRKEYPELGAGHWILTRDHSIEKARQCAELRRKAFPKTVK